MSWRKRLVVVAAVIFGMVLFTACNSETGGESSNNENNDNNESASNDGNNNNNNNNNENEANSNENEEVAEEDRPTITMMISLHTPEVPGDKILNLVQDATNVNLDIEWVPDNNYSEKLNTAFATGTLPEVVGVGMDQMDQFKEAIRDDQFWEVGPYLDEYENLGKLKDTIVENTKVNGKVYGLYQGRPLSRQGIIYRKDWADNLGLSAPETTEEFYEMARAFTEDDPNESGEDDTTGLTDRNDLIYGAFKTVASWFGTPNYWGEEDGELLPEFMFPEYVEAMDFMKDLRENAYINQDFPVTSKTDQQEMLKNGTAGLYVGSMGDIMSLYEDAKDLNSDVEFDVTNYIEGPDGEYSVWAIPGFGAQMLFPKSAIETEEQLEEILAFYDQLMTPEVSNLFQWGIEGEHYELKDGKADISSEKGALHEREVLPFNSILIGEPETNGHYESTFTYEPRQKAEDLYKDNEDYLINDPTVTLESETDIEQGERLQEIINDATYNYMLGEIDEDGFEQQIEEWKNQGGDDIIKEYNESFQEVEE